MKKFLILILCIFTIAIGAQAQQTEVKVKKTTTPVQKVHNMTHRHKHYKGYKVKRKYASGHVTKTKVDKKTGEVEVKHN